MVIFVRIEDCVPRLRSMSQCAIKNPPTSGINRADGPMKRQRLEVTELKDQSETEE